MHCTNCHSDITAWLNKYKVVSKIRLDELYFREENLHSRWDENGLYIEGQRFYDHELKKAFERCPKCSAKNSMKIDDEEITWAPI